MLADDEEDAAAASKKKEVPLESTAPYYLKYR